MINKINSTYRQIILKEQKEKPKKVQNTIKTGINQNKNKKGN